ncbi:hypothetical protein [Streptomyces sp. HNM0574]|uniref:hypothetical protein n=1 Tax=Streptomyces sp. HNM0574 TaxID=2714954 RepID=UPI00146F3A10|nr:hypothetical protein [Streptomyces sp. HNM0574]NLU70583.1 hypothetical protein [Streptomyces sp. HNM0574]
MERAGREERRGERGPRRAARRAPVGGSRAGAPSGAAGLAELQGAAGNDAVVRMLREGRQGAGAPAVQRVPEEGAQEPRSVFESDTDSASESGAPAGEQAKSEEAALPFHKRLRPLRTVIEKGRTSPEAKDKPWTVTAKIDSGASWVSRDFYRGEVGHVWIEVVSPLGDSTEFGFYPAEPITVRSAPGEIMCPDGHEGHDERKTARVGFDDVVEGYHAAFARTGARYHLGGYNCAAFASEVWNAMTGKPLPNGLLVANPASAAESVGAERELRKAYGEGPLSDETEDLIEQASSGRMPPAM